MLSLSVWFALVALAQMARCHIQLTFPPPINSKYDPQTPQNAIDYSMTSPLAADGKGYGSAYPCKGYNTPEAMSRLSPVATLTAGQSFTTTLEGSALHGGGSCQYSVSYDGGETFVVIHSFIGGCPIGLTHTFTVPTDLPASSKAIFAWTWVNLVGNRELYMNCAVVKIAGSSSSFTGPRLFRANTFGNGQCVTQEGVNVVYPNPGRYVTYAGGASASDSATALSPCSYDENINITVSPGGSSPSPPTTVQPPAPSSSTVSSSPRPTATTTSTSRTTVGRTKTPAQATNSRTKTRPGPSPTSTSRAPLSTPQPGSGSGSGSASYIVCDSLTTWSLCTGSQCVFMGNVAPGTNCVNGQIVHATSNPSSNDETAPLDVGNIAGKVAAQDQADGVRCDSPTSWSLCADGRCTPMGGTADGTHCINGQMVAAARFVKLHRRSLQAQDRH